MLADILTGISNILLNLPPALFFEILLALIIKLPLLPTVKEFTFNLSNLVIPI